MDAAMRVLLLVSLFLAPAQAASAVLTAGSSQSASLSASRVGLPSWGAAPLHPASSTQNGAWRVILTQSNMSSVVEVPSPVRGLVSGLGHLFASNVLKVECGGFKAFEVWVQDAAERVAELRSRASGAAWCGFLAFFDPEATCRVSVNTYRTSYVGLRLSGPLSSITQVLRDDIQCSLEREDHFAPELLAAFVGGVVLVIKGEELAHSTHFRLVGGAFVFATFALVIGAVLLGRRLRYRAAISAYVLALSSAVLRVLYGSWWLAWEDLLWTKWFMVYLGVALLAGMALSYLYDPGPESNPKLTTVIQTGMRLMGLMTIMGAIQHKPAGYSLCAILVLQSLFPEQFFYARWVFFLCGRRVHRALAAGGARPGPPTSMHGQQTVHQQAFRSPGQGLAYGSPGLYRHPMNTPSPGISPHVPVSYGYQQGGMTSPARQFSSPRYSPQPPPNFPQSNQLRSPHLHQQPNGLAGDIPWSSTSLAASPTPYQATPSELAPRPYGFLSGLFGGRSQPSGPAQGQPQGPTPPHQEQGLHRTTPSPLASPPRPTPSASPPGYGPVATKGFFGVRFQNPAARAPSIEPPKAQVSSPQSFNRYRSPQAAQAPLQAERILSPPQADSRSPPPSEAPKRVPFNAHLLQKKRAAPKNAAPTAVEPPQKLFKAGFRREGAPATPKEATPAVVKAPSPPRRSPTGKTTHKQVGAAAGQLESPLWKMNKVVNEETGRTIDVGKKKYNELVGKGYIVDKVKGVISPPPKPSPKPSPRSRPTSPAMSPPAKRGPSPSPTGSTPKRRK